MPNSIKYNTVSESLALKKGDFWIGTGDVGKGTTASTGFYNGTAPASGGYTIYLNKSGGPAIYLAANDSQLITLTNIIASANYNNVNDCFNWFAGQNDKMVVNRDYEPIITNGLIVNVDAGYVPSYPRNGSNWKDISTNAYNCSLIGSPTYSSSAGGVIVFDTSNYAEINVNSWIRSLSSAYTFMSFFYYNGGSSGGAPYCLTTSPLDGNNNDGFWQHLNLGNWLWRTEDNVSGEFGGNVEAPSTFTNGLWYFEATVVKTNALTFYRNGSLVANISTSFNWASLRNDGTAFIYLATGYFPNTGYNMNGWIGTFQMYNRELSAAEVLQNYNAQKGRFGL